jgi:glutamate racemase
VVACNSATSAAGDLIREKAAQAGVPVVTVIGPEAEIAAAITDSGRVGVLATPATVSSGAYHRALEAQGRPLTVTEVAAPDLAPIIQEGFPFDQSVMDTVRGYCEPLREAGVDTLILGCTHYPLVAPMLQRFLGRDVRLVTAGHAIAAAVQRSLVERGEAVTDGEEGGYRFLVTGDVDAFVELGTRFLQLPLAGRAEALRYA